MLPIPVKNFLPDIMAEDGDDALMTAFCAKVDKIVGELSDDTKQLSYFRDPMKIPEQFLDAAGVSLAAGILAQDNEATKRKKLARAVANYSMLALWEPCKVIIDAVTGTSASLYSSWATTGAYLMRGGESTEDDNYAASMGCDGIDDLLGIYMIGAGDEFEEPGHVLIDTGNDSLTAEQIASIVAQIQRDYCPAYFLVTIGYTDIDDVFYEYITI